MNTANLHPNSPVRHTARHQVASRFSDPLDCLTAHLVLECSEALAGIKPASLVSLVNRQRSCGRNLYHLWQQHSHELSAALPMLRFRVLQSSERALLLFCYHPEQLAAHLSHPGIRALLVKAGYDGAGDSSDLLEELNRRIAGHGSFPHEIGLFIGYPAKDVAAFMGLVKLPFTCQGPWKIFGNPEKSLCLAGSFRRTRRMVGTLLEQCATPCECIDRLNCLKNRFSGPTNDKKFHCHNQEVHV
ncbi:DUF3793 family protein [Trichlorobacter ammonificans]|uniref:DUF3793 family protein n=1 Tax=Trichlorobacter ammonificans TaxID=2916410 RepID=A0ABM9D672_9BACT|nr:DUF3793 family protein [Trichlorobacter ammonificans]CAH2030646.1 conserved protein of unknown function [Trichlorobacter ammonificans]